MDDIRKAEVSISLTKAHFYKKFSDRVYWNFHELGVQLRKEVEEEAQKISSSGNASFKESLELLEPIIEELVEDMFTTLKRAYSPNSKKTTE